MSTIEYLPALEARNRSGVRLVVTKDIPVPWGEGAKSILHLKNIDHIRVYHVAGMDDPDLIEWTGIDNAPILIVDDERPLDRWAQIILRLEELQPDPPIIPSDEGDRMMMFGILHELLEPDGYLWNRRHWLNLRASDSANAAAPQDVLEKLRRKYSHVGGSDPVTRMRDIWARIGKILRQQEAAGSRYLIGNSVTAADIYMATCYALVDPLAGDLCPMHPTLREAYSEGLPEILDAMDPIVQKHRDFVYSQHLDLPLQL